MNDVLTDDALDRMIRCADPLRDEPPPSTAGREAAFERLLAVAGDRELPRARITIPTPETLLSEAGLRLEIARERIGVVVSRGTRVPAAPRRLVAGVTAGVAASATAAILLLGTSAPPPAFAVTRHSDGSVSLSLRRMSGIAGANRQLAADGVRERVMAVDSGQSVPQGCTTHTLPVGTMSLAPGPQPSASNLRAAAARARANGYPAAAQQLDAMANGTYTPPNVTGNSGPGTGNTGTGGGQVAVCATGPSGNTGNSGNTGAG